MSPRRLRSWLVAAAGAAIAPALWGAEYQTVAAGDDFSVYLRSDGTVVAWGNNASGQCDVPSGLSGVVGVSAGMDHVMALKSDGTVVVWGSAMRPSLREVPVVSGRITHMAAGVFHNEIVTDRLHSYRFGALTGSGIEPAAILRLSAGHQSSRRIHVGNAEGIVDMDAGWYGSLTVDSTGAVVFTGALEFQTGYIQPALARVASVHSGRMGNAVIHTDGTVTAWTGGQPSLSVQAPSNLAEVVALDIGSTHTIAKRRDGSVVQWGTADAVNAHVFTVPTGLLGLAAPAAAPRVTGPTADIVGSLHGPVRFVIATDVRATGFAATGLPPGWTVDATTGVVSGWADAAGTWQVRVHAANDLGADARDVTVRIAAETVTPVITSPGSALGYAGVPFSYRITAANGPTSYAVTGLPAGWSFEAATGTISGTPTAAGSVSLAVTAANSAGSDTETLVIVISNDTPPASGGEGSGASGGGGCGLGGLGGLIAGLGAMAWLGLARRRPGPPRPGPQAG